MTLNQALAIGNARKNSVPHSVYRLVAGFEPLHLATLLKAHLLERISGGVELHQGVYGDFLGNLESMGDNATAAAVVLEWSDLDPRLGMRSSGGWTREIKSAIAEGARQRFASIETALQKLAARMPVALVPPSLPLPPIGSTTRVQSSAFELELSHQLAAFLLRVSQFAGVRVIQSPRVEPVLDARMELAAGFPFTIPFADSLAAAIVAVLWPVPPKKGLITDLDDTLWSGLVGEIGPDAVSWSQEFHTQTHGLYQQMLGHLASSGVLIAISSKNELSTVEAALARKDLFVDPKSFFPVCANWGPKSAGVAQILSTWNISPDAVVFIDDNPMEIEEVRRAYPQITGFHFNGKDPNAVWSLLGALRDLFGKPILTEEDAIRQASIRAGAKLKELAGDDSGSPEFLRTLAGTVTFGWDVAPSDTRPLELINKTNQFNLNGQRIGEGEWQRELADPATVIAVVSYTDKFGPLGKVAVMMGSRRANSIHISHWVMSCRAFSRRLEYHTIDGFFRETNAAEITFAFGATQKNKPLQEFFRAAGIGPDDEGTWRLTRAAFAAQALALPHEVVDLRK